MTSEYRASTTDQPSNLTLGAVGRKTMAPFLVPSSRLFVPVNAYFVPALVLCTLVCNVLVCLVLLKPNMRTTTNTILTAMAVADTLTGLCPLPCYLYFYTAGGYREWLSYDWCYGYFCLTDFLPSIFHTASVWLTLLLAVQRYFSVCRSQSSRRLCTIGSATAAAWAILVVAALSQVGRFVEMDYFPVPLRSRLARKPARLPLLENVDVDVDVDDSRSYRESANDRSSIFATAISLLQSTTTAQDDNGDIYHYHHHHHSSSSNSGIDDVRVIGCTFAMKKSLVPIQHLYFNAHYLFRIVFIHVVPCMSLIVINGILLKTMREGQTRRTRLLKMNRLSESRRLAEVNRTTLMLVTVVALFLVVEVPSAIIFVLHVLQNSFGLVSIINYRNAENVTTVVNLIILLSYPMNFFIYCAMSTQFRVGFVNLFCSRPTATTAASGYSVGVDKNCPSTSVQPARSRFEENALARGRSAVVNVTFKTPTTSDATTATAAATAATTVTTAAAKNMSAGVTSTDQLAASPIGTSKALADNLTTASDGLQAITVSSVV